MKILLRILLAVLHLAALGAAGWYGWRFREQYRALDAERSDLVAENARLRTESDRIRADLRRLAEAKDALGRNLVSALASCQKQEDLNRKLMDDKAKAEAALRGELRRQAERLRTSDERTARAVGEAENRGRLALEEAEKRSRLALEEAEKRARRAREEEPGLDSLSELVELTDRAPRKAN